MNQNELSSQAFNSLYPVKLSEDELAELNTLLSSGEDIDEDLLIELQEAMYE